MFLYANTAPAGIAGPYYVRLWVDRPSEVRPSSTLPAGMDKIQRQTHEHVYWMELTELTLANLVAGIDRILSPGFRYRMLVGARGQGTRLLRDDPEEALPLAKMIRITNSRDVRIWWSMNPPSEPIDLLFCAHRSTNTEDSTPSEEAWPRSNEEPNSDGHQPESSAAATKRTTSSRTTTSRNTTKTTGRTHRINSAEVGESELESDVTADRGLDLVRGRSRPRIPALHHLLVSKLLSLVLTWALVF